MRDLDTLLTREPKIYEDAQVVNCQLGDYTEICEGCKLLDSSIGAYSYCFQDNDIFNAEIGKFASIATGVRINPVQHPTYSRPSQHHFTYRCNHYGFGPADESIQEVRHALKVVIGNDVWIGHNAIIMGGVTIGDGAVIGAGAVVTHDVAPYEIVVGVPAKHLRWRFEEPIRNAIAATKWWDWDHETLKERIGDFQDLRLFLDKYC